jgi:hypothetical protein
MKAIRNIAAASILLFSSLAVAQTEVPTFTTGSLKLEDTTFQVGQYTEGVTVTCDSENCDGAFTPLVAPIEVTCPAPAGETCTFAVTVDAAGESRGLTEGVFRYVGDALTTIPDRVNPSNLGFYMWSLNNAEGTFSASHTFVALVKNTKNSQKHSVEIDLGCFVSGGVGSCSVRALGLFEAGPFGSPVTVTTQVFRERKGENRDSD